MAEAVPASGVPAARVPGNRWDLLDAPAFGAWEPTQTVSVVVPHYEAPEELELTLAAFAEQTYPRHLIEVIIADDGSAEEPAVPAVAEGLDVRVVTQEHRGYGAGRARNLGAAAARGDILVFVDSDMVPDPVHVEAHARWHHVAGDAVTLGSRHHVDVSGVGGRDIRRAAHEGSLAPLFDGRPQRPAGWVDGHLKRTAGLTSWHDDLFRVVTSGNLGMRAETFARVGGFDTSFQQWGSEDTEIGYRLFTDGALLIYDDAAHCWHQGAGTFEGAEAAALLDRHRPKVAHLIAHRGFRQSSPGRSFTIPRVTVTVAVDDEPGDRVVASVRAVLASDFHDLVVFVRMPAEHPDAAWVDWHFGPDPRVRLGAEVAADEAMPQSPVRVHVPVGVEPAPKTVGALVTRLESSKDPLGVVYVTVPGAPVREVTLTAFTTRAWCRASRVGDRGEDTLVVAGELFGERWVSGYDVGMGPDPLEVAAAAPAPVAPTEVPTTVQDGGADELLDDLSPEDRARVIAVSRRLTPAYRRLASLYRRAGRSRGGAR